MEFRLIYEGTLSSAGRSATRVKEKHDIRKRFHPQLKRLWEIHPNLPDSKTSIRLGDSGSESVRTIDHLASRFGCGPYRFVPVVTEYFGLICSVDILFLRPEIPGTLIKSGDIDNRLKVLFDAMRIPADTSELAGNTPGPTEDPFYCLLQDDRLITHLSINTDMLLAPIRDPINDNDVRLVIKVTIRPSIASFGGLAFI